jgi:hypothetical protein
LSALSATNSLKVTIAGKQVVLTGCEPELFDGYGECNRIYVEKGMARNV